MPHFVIHCSDSILEKQAPADILTTVHEIAVASELFDLKSIKVRILPYQHYLIAGERNDFLNVFADIMEGRSTEQKAALSQEVIKALKQLFPDVPMAMSIRDIEKASYCNSNMD